MCFAADVTVWRLNRAGLKGTWLFLANGRVTHTSPISSPSPRVWEKLRWPSPVRTAGVTRSSDRVRSGITDTTPGEHKMVLVDDQKQNAVFARSHTTVNPFLRWAGGKRWLGDLLTSTIELSNVYHEPFVGGASIFLSSNPSASVLSDSNVRLMETYRAVKRDPAAILEVISKWENTRDDYYTVRSTTMSKAVTRAAQFIFLNRTCWNGLYRVNKMGEFNVPFGNNPDRQIVDAENLLAVAGRLQTTRLLSGDFARSERRAVSGDFVYLDPPYAVRQSKAGFLRYSPKVFSWQDQVRLSRMAHRLADRGCHVAVSNAHCAEVLDLYRDFYSRPLSRQSRLAASAEHRTETTEVIFTTFPLSSSDASIELEATQ